MKKSFLLGIMVLFLFSSDLFCAKSKFGEKIKEAIKDTTSSLKSSSEKSDKGTPIKPRNNSGNSGGTKIKLPSSDSSKIASGQPLKTPQSYETAYKYRTDKADKNISLFIKNKTTDAIRATNPDEYVKTIVNKINELAQNDFEKVKFAHDAICLLVSYDAKNFWANTVPDQNWQNVVKTKTAVCEGYANLFQKFMSELKINSQKISGYARGVGTDITTENPKNSNHAWNIVRIEECWYLIDCTWDSGHMTGKTSVQAYNTDWLFLKPEHFIYTHFPTTNSNHQLMAQPLSIEEFSALPDFRPKVFEYTGETLRTIKKINSTEDCLNLEYKIQDGVSLEFVVNKIGGNQINNRTLTENNSGKITTKINFPDAGDYSISLYYWKEGSKTGQSCGKFIVKASAGNKVKYPTLYPVSAKKVSIITPKESPLVAGNSVKFEIHLEGKNYISIFAGKDVISLENDGNGNFTGELTIPKGITKISIGVSDNGKGGWQTMAVYEVK